MEEEKKKEGELEEILDFDYVKHSQVWRVLRGCHPHIEYTHTHTGRPTT